MATASIRSHNPPARTPSKTSHAFRSHRNDFSPFGSLAELNAATSPPPSMYPPPRGSEMMYAGSYAGSDRGRAPPVGRAPSNLGPPPADDDDRGSFYGEEVDYGKVQPSHLHPGEGHFAAYAGSSQSRMSRRTPSPAGSSRSSLGKPNPPFAQQNFDWPGDANPARTASRQPSHMGSIRPGSHMRQAASHGGGSLRPGGSVAGSQHFAPPSRAGTGWGSRAPSSSGQRPPELGEYGANGVHHAYDYEDEFLPPHPPGPQKWQGSRAGTANGSDNHVPTIQVEGPYQDRLSGRSVSPAMVTHPVMRARSSRASIHYSSPPVASGSGGHHHHDDDDDAHYNHLQTQIMRSKSTRSSMRRPPPRALSSTPSRATIASIARSGRLPVHFEQDEDNIILRVYLPWTDRLKENPCKFHVTGADGKPYKLEVDYQWTKMVHGAAKFRGAGSPKKGGGRGHLIIEWEIWFPDDDDGSITD